ncbi:hypothetical protein [Sulfitobacter pontiacus]|uniref:hypothetical protein n=1 Tax=Sulfitobacter pontiacus TaxID=60137 RepID=UPI0030EF11BC|tara:strand:+ start:3160 stop:3450 length:291 start_codon:yes stop_codon:yes gene_type:complete
MFVSVKAASPVPLPRRVTAAFGAVCILNTGRNFFVSVSQVLGQLGEVLLHLSLGLAAIGCHDFILFDYHDKNLCAQICCEYACALVIHINDVGSLR